MAGAIKLIAADVNRRVRARTRAQRYRPSPPSGSTKTRLNNLERRPLPRWNESRRRTKGVRCYRCGVMGMGLKLRGPFLPAAKRQDPSPTVPKHQRRSENDTAEKERRLRRRNIGRGSAGSVRSHNVPS
jgi:hypothetical protein